MVIGLLLEAGKLWKKSGFLVSQAGNTWDTIVYLVKLWNQGYFEILPIWLLRIVDMLVATILRSS